MATAHRAENVDDSEILKQLFRIFTRCPVPVVYPIHPRTRERFREASLEADLEGSENVVFLPPIGYFDFLALLMQGPFVLTDSGALYEGRRYDVGDKAGWLRANLELAMEWEELRRELGDVGLGGKG